MRSAIKRVIGKIDGNDFLILAGMGLLGFGLMQVSLALAAGVTGGLLLAIGLAGSWRKGTSK